MNSNTTEIKANKAWKTLIAESSYELSKSQSSIFISRIN